MAKISLPHIWRNELYRKHIETMNEKPLEVRVPAGVNYEDRHTPMGSLTLRPSLSSHFCPAALVLPHGTDSSHSIANY